MQSSTSPNLLTATVIFLLLTAPLIGGLLEQNTSQSPSPTPDQSPSPSPSASPVIRAPSSTPLPGAQNFHQWGAVTVFNGLPSDSVRAIAQTPDGVMWFGTDNGLARFDGRRVQTFTPGGSGSEQILAIKTAGNGDLWIGTQAGAFVYSEGHFIPVSGASDLGITCILLGKDTYLGTDNGFVLRVVSNADGTITAEKVAAEPVPAVDNLPVSIGSLAEKDGILIIATTGRGVFSLKNGNLNVVPTSPAPGSANSLATADGSLWIGAEATKGASGLYRSTGTERFERIAAPTAKILTLEADATGVWAGTERNGLFHFAESKLKKTYTFENTSGGLRSNTVYALFTDREGVSGSGRIAASAVSIASEHRRRRSPIFLMVISSAVFMLRATNTNMPVRTADCSVRTEKIGSRFRD